MPLDPCKKHIGAGTVVLSVLLAFGQEVAAHALAGLLIDVVWWAVTHLL